MVEPILISPYFLNYILPFVLVFTLIFAILEKTKLLGEDNKQVSAIVGAIVGLILIAYPFARDIVVLLMPFLAVFAVILLVFMLLYGFITGKTDGDVLGTGWKIAFAVILSLSMITILLMITGYWDLVWDLMFGGRGGQIWINGLLFVVIIGAIVAVIRGGGKSGGGE